MNKYQVTINFKWNEAAVPVLEKHRNYIDSLINDQVIEHYAVSMETQTAWVTINANNKTQVRKLLNKSPFQKFWTLQINELVLWDGQNYRLPLVQLN